MQVIKKGFSIKHEILEVSSIKPGGSGKLPNGNTYSASVKFRALNIVEDEFEDTFTEVEEIIEYKIPCADNAEASLLTDFIRKLRASNTPIYFNSSIPKLYQGSQVYNAISMDSVDKFISMNGGKLKTKEEDKKAS